MQANTRTLAEFRNEIYLSLKRLENSKETRSKRNSRLVHDIRDLKSAVVSINRYLLAFSPESSRKLLLKQGTCQRHERLGLVTWERGDVSCPVCDRNKFIESQADKLGIKHFPVWDAYFCLWDLPPPERKKRVEQLKERFREIDEKRRADEGKNSTTRLSTQ